MNLPANCVQLVAAALKRERLELEASSLATRTRLPRLEGLTWRVDVTISSSSLLRVFRPSIMMQMALSDGRIKTFDVSVEQFHQLRYNVAKVLRDMQVRLITLLDLFGMCLLTKPIYINLSQELERHPIMRIADEASKKTFEE
jgi:hypothetical protein